MRLLELTLFLFLAAALPQLAQAQYGGDPETGYTAPPGTQPVAPATRSTGRASGGDGIRLAMQARFSGVNVLGGEAFAVSVLATPGLRLASNKLFIGLGLGWAKVNSGGPSAYTVAPTATYDVIQRSNAALHLLAVMNISDRTGGDLLIGMNLGVGVRALLGESFSIGTEWGFAFTQVDGGPTDPDAAFGFFGALMIESSIGL